MEETTEYGAMDKAFPKEREVRSIGRVSLRERIDRDG